MRSCSELIESYLQHLHPTLQNNSGKKRRARESPAQAHYQPAKTPLGEINMPCKAQEKNTSGSYCNIATPAKMRPYQSCLVRCRFRLSGPQGIAGKARITGISALLFTSVEFNLASQTYAVLQLNKPSCEMDLNLTLGAEHVLLWGQTWVKRRVP